MATGRPLAAMGVLLVACLTTRPAMAQRPRIAVDPVVGEKVTAEIRERVTQSVTEGLLAAGADVGGENPGYVLRGKLEVEGRSYALRLEMVDTKTGAVVVSREDRCEICTEAEAFETASTAASALKAQVLKRAAGAPAGTPLAASAPTPPTPAAAAEPVVQIQSAPPPSSDHRALGWVGVAGGLVSAGVGAYLISIDGNPACDMPFPPACANERSTLWGGVGLIGLGVVVVGAGVLALLGKI